MHETFILLPDKLRNRSFHLNFTKDNNTQKLRFFIVPIGKNYEETNAFLSELYQRGAPLLRTGAQPGTMYSGPLRDSGNINYTNNTKYVPESKF